MHRRPIDVTGDPQGQEPRRAAWAALALILVAVTLSCSGLVARHRWSDEWGPMVPHATFPTDCGLCHLPDRWDALKEDFSFDHEAETGFALQGAHSRAACLRCHNDRGPVQAYLARGCGGCHVDPHKSTLEQECTRCHGQYDWYPGGLIEEHNRTRFPLVASHALATCESCHDRATVGEFRGAPVECHLCHQEEANLAQINHVVNGWVVGCENCHDLADWRPVNFDHSLFPLQGGHASVSCNACHAGGLILGTPNDCFSCHSQDYINTGTHVPGGFSTDCTQCHNTFDWTNP
jgi:hypothetical protein